MNTISPRLCKIEEKTNLIIPKFRRIIAKRTELVWSQAKSKRKHQCLFNNLLKITVEAQDYDV